MNMQNFAQIVLDQFKFLISDYGFKRSKKGNIPGVMSLSLLITPQESELHTSLEKRIFSSCFID
jgi:hypothetical protein